LKKEEKEGLKERSGKKNSPWEEEERPEYQGTVVHRQDQGRPFGQSYRVLQLQQPNPKIK